MTKQKQKVGRSKTDPKYIKKSISLRKYWSPSAIQRWHTKRHPQTSSVTDLWNATPSRKSNLNKKLIFRLQCTKKNYNNKARKQSIVEALTYLNLGTLNSGWGRKKSRKCINIFRSGDFKQWMGKKKRVESPVAVIKGLLDASDTLHPPPPIRLLLHSPKQRAAVLSKIWSWSRQLLCWVRYMFRCRVVHQWPLAHDEKRKWAKY